MNTENTELKKFQKQMNDYRIKKSTRTYRYISEIKYLDYEGSAESFKEFGEYNTLDKCPKTLINVSDNDYVVAVEETYTPADVLIEQKEVYEAAKKFIIDLICSDDEDKDAISLYIELNKTDVEYYNTQNEYYPLLLDLLTDFYEDYQRNENLALLINKLKRK